MVLNRWLLLDADLAWTHTRSADTNGATLKDLGPWSAGVTLRYIGRCPLSQDNAMVAPATIVTSLRVNPPLVPTGAMVHPGEPRQLRVPLQVRI